MRTILPRGVAVMAALALGVAGCGSAGESSEPAPRIVVTTNILGDVVRHLVGNEARVEVIMPTNADPHDFAPSPKQAVAMRSADLLVVNGGGFEAGLVDTISAAETDGATVVTATEEVALLDDDPHVFTSPTNMVAIAEAIAVQLVKEVPALDTPSFRAQVEGYVAELRALDSEVETLLGVVPVDRRILVTNHEVFGYFAARYDFEILGAVIPAGSTLAEPSAKDISHLASVIADAGVPAIFADASSSTRVAAALAGEGADVEVVELFSESLGEPGSGGDTYIHLMRTNARRIAAALR